MAERADELPDDVAGSCHLQQPPLGELVDQDIAVDQSLLPGPIGAPEPIPLGGRPGLGSRTTRPEIGRYRLAPLPAIGAASLGQLP